jgi:hypothetical protein
MNARRKQTGNALEKQCDTTANGNAGCGVQAPVNTSSSAFNENGGGVYATEWRDDGIRMWFFGRGNEPSDLTNTTATPDPSTWGEPTADFPDTHCDIGNHFRNASIIMNIALCGDWAGAQSIYSGQGDCPGTCDNFVANNATAFEDAYWEIKSFRVFSAE